MDLVRKLFRSVCALFSSTPMPVPAAQQSHVSDTYCDHNASQGMASTVGGTARLLFQIVLGLVLLEVVR